MGIAEPTIFIKDYIVNIILKEFAYYLSTYKQPSDFEKNIIFVYDKYKYLIKNKELYKKFPVKKLNINLKFVNMTSDKYRRRFLDLPKMSVWFASEAAALDISTNYKDYSDDNNSYLDKNGNLYLNTEFKLSFDGKNSDYKAHKSDLRVDIESIIFHELNHLYEDYQMKKSGRKKNIYAFYYALGNPLNITNKVFRTWNKNLLFLMYLSIPSEQNAMVHEMLPILRKYKDINVEDYDDIIFKNIEDLKRYDYIKRYNIIKRDIEKEYPGQSEFFMNRLKDTFCDNYEKGLKIYNEKSTFNITKFRKMSTLSFMKYWSKFIIKAGNNLYRKKSKLYSYLEQHPYPNEYDDFDD